VAPALNTVHIIYDRREVISRWWQREEPLTPSLEELGVSLSIEEEEEEEETSRGVREAAVRTMPVR